MNLAMRYRLQAVIRYHDEFAERLRLENEQAAQQDSDTDDQAEQQPAEQDQVSNLPPPQQKLFHMHREVARQLRAVLEAEPVQSGITEARLAPNRVYRDMGRMPPRTTYQSAGIIH
jgi:hypothetical protein